MAEKEIVGSVRKGGQLYTGEEDDSYPGPDELEDRLTSSEIAKLKRRGVIAGDWTPGRPEGGGEEESGRNLEPDEGRGDEPPADEGQDQGGEEDEPEAEAGSALEQWNEEYSRGPDDYLERYGDDAPGSELAQAALEEMEEGGE